MIRAFLCGTAAGAATVAADPALAMLCALAALAIVGWVGIALISYLRARRRAHLAKVFDPIRNWRGGRL
jgi:acyl-coenzyme A thioesterase PaaI-like protein